MIKKKKKKQLQRWKKILLTNESLILFLPLCRLPAVKVKVKGEEITFALKVIEKKNVVENRQEEHIHSERRILAEARSPFIVRSLWLLLLKLFWQQYDFNKSII